MLVEMTETEKQDWDKFRQWRSWTEVAYQGLYEMYEGAIPIEDCSEAIRPVIEQFDYFYYGLGLYGPHDQKNAAK